jgi:hypothetical protein
MDRREQISRIFHAALMRDAHERDAYLNRRLRG